MALNGGSTYLNTNVPVAGSPVTGVATTSVPQPTSTSANHVVAANTLMTLPLTGAATTNTLRAVVLPANHVVVDWFADIVTTAVAGAFTLGVLGQNCADVDGGVALTLDALVANSTFSQSVTVQAGARTRGTIALPAVTTNAVTKNASVAVPVPYDRVIGLLTGTAITTNDAVISLTILMAAV